MVVAVKGASLDREELRGEQQDVFRLRCVETSEECRDACNADSRCKYFILHFEDAAKRVCQLIDVKRGQNIDNWYSGENFCV